MKGFIYLVLILSQSLLLGAQSVQTSPAEQAESAVPAPTTEKEQERPTHRFDQAWLRETAKALSEMEYQPERLEEDNPLNQLSYDDYKRIQFERGATIWSREDRNFRINPLHPGFLFKIPVKLNLVVGGVSRRILYTTKIFNYDEDQEQLKLAQAPGYSGFSVTHPINTDDKWDEFMVFQGGTYFRAVGQDNWYGISARGLAINTAKPSGEEFPVFKEFWIERPSTKDESLVIHALMDSPSASGAFTFTANPGQHTQIKVESTLYPRKEIPHYGIAPLTSMFLFNSIGRTRFADFRPAVHDSDGLLMLKSNNEHIWRALSNPERLEVSVFEDDSIKGFGLMQRSREFHQFEDMEALYHERPSAWVEPNGDWGPGHVELIEIPTDAEIHDNIVAFWQPKEALKQSEPATFNYTLHFGSQAPLNYEEGKVISSASGLALGSNTAREFVIDYALKQDKLNESKVTEYSASAVPSNIQVNAIASTGTIIGTISKFIPQTGNLRVVVKFEPSDATFSELRVSLSSNDMQWGETWLYRWSP